MLTIRLTVNGTPVTAQVDPASPLIDFLRNDLHLTGTKHGCDRGECGACTVIMNGDAIDSCITPVAKADGANIVTVEGLASAGQLSALQRSFIETGAIQCGFCTPGMLMSAQALLNREPHPTDTDIREAIGGNICRCTGYTKIVQAIASAARELNGGMQHE